MGKVLNHSIQISLLERFETSGIRVRFRQPGAHLALLCGYHVLACAFALGLEKFVAMIVEPARELPPFFRRQGLNGGFHLLDTHVGKLTPFPSSLLSKR